MKTFDTTRIHGITVALEECITCGVPFTVPLTVIEQHYANGGYHSCPNGHQQGWSKDRSENAIIRRERDRLKQETARLEDRIREEREQREAAERRAAAQKGQVTRLKNRAKAGMCPCCNRHFTNLERHISTKHPDFDPVADETNVVPLKAG